MPNLAPSISRPTALVKSPLPSASISTSEPTSWALPEASITNTSFTDTQAIRSMPLALRSAAWSLKPGRWRAEQVGVKAPGTANRATVLPAKMSLVVFAWGPSGVMVRKVASGKRSPTLIVMVCGSWVTARSCRAKRAPRSRGRDRISAGPRLHRKGYGSSVGPMSSNYLAGQVLIAMPGIDDPRFERAVILMCAHSPDHGMGLALNRPVEGLALPDLLRRLGVQPNYLMEE